MEVLKNESIFKRMVYHGINLTNESASEDQKGKFIQDLENPGGIINFGLKGGLVNDRKIEF